MEYLNLYDMNENVIGKIERNEKTDNGYLVKIVVGVIINKKNQILIQKTSIEKGQEWALTGGHVSYGESSLDGVKREIKEELGIDVNDATITIFKKVNDGRRFCDLYEVKKDFDINNLHYQKEEVETAKWATIDEVNELINQGLFKKAHGYMFKDYLKYKEGND